MNTRELITQVSRERGIPNDAIFEAHILATEMSKIDEEQEVVSEKALEEELTPEEEQKYRKILESYIWPVMRYDRFRQIMKEEGVQGDEAFFTVFWEQRPYDHIDEECLRKTAKWLVAKQKKEGPHR